MVRNTDFPGSWCIAFGEETVGMISRHRPPFNVGSFLAALSRHSAEITVEEVEAGYAATCNLPYAVLLPSARAGICWALRAAIDRESLVVGPAYTCQVVHEAMARVGTQLRFVDTNANGFLMDSNRLACEQNQNHALVLCEVYGYSYNSYQDVERSQVAPRIRIVDAAMTVPVPQVFQSMRDGDFAVVSFGLGKCIYAGWGGMGLTKSAGLAQEVRARRNAYLHPENLALLLRRGTEVFLRTVAHSRRLYGVLRHFRSPPRFFPTFPSTWAGDISLSKEWYLPSTRIDRGLACYNLERRAHFFQQRLALAARYHENLCGSAGIALPPPSRNALSHYTIRVSPHFRDAIQAALAALGVDTGVLFRFPGYLPKDEFPNANKMSFEVINLPLDACLTKNDVDYICDCLIRCVSRICLKSIEPKEIKTFQHESTT